MEISFEANARAVLEEVVQEREFQALTKIPVVAAMEVGLVMAAFGLFAASSYFYLLGQLPLVVMWTLNAVAVYMSFTPLHDATHRSLSSHRRVNDLCLLYTSPSPRDQRGSRMPSSA